MLWLLRMLWWRRWRGRVTVPCGQQLAMSPHPDFICNKPDDSAKDEQWDPEKPCGLHYAVFGYAGGVGRVNRAEHRHHVATDTDVLAQADHAEKADEVMFDRRIIVRMHVAEKSDNVVAGKAGDVHVAEEDHDIMIDVALGVHAAEEADSIVNRAALRHVDVASELDSIIVRVGGGRCEDQDGKEQGSGREMS